jgi:hypothetical protein
MHSLHQPECERSIGRLRHNDTTRHDTTTRTTDVGRSRVNGHRTNAPKPKGRTLAGREGKRGTSPSERSSNPRLVSARRPISTAWSSHPHLFFQKWKKRPRSCATHQNCTVPLLLLPIVVVWGGGKKKKKVAHFGHVGRLVVSRVVALLLFLLGGLGAGALEVGSERGAALVKCERRRTQLLPGGCKPPPRASTVSNAFQG